MCVIIIILLDPVRFRIIKVVKNDFIHILMNSIMYSIYSAQIPFGSWSVAVRDFFFLFFRFFIFRRSRRQSFVSFLGSDHRQDLFSFQMRLPHEFHRWQTFHSFHTLNRNKIETWWWMYVPAWMCRKKNQFPFIGMGFFSSDGSKVFSVFRVMCQCVGYYLLTQFSVVTFGSTVVDCVIHFGPTYEVGRYVGRVPCQEQYRVSK